MHRLLAALVAVTLVVLVPGPASAGPRTSVPDPDDVITNLDLSRVSLTAKGPRIIVDFSTYGAFTRDDLDGANGLHLRFGLARKRYREVLVQSLDGRWVATICSGRVGRLTIDRDCSVLKRPRAGDGSMRVVIPRRLVDPGARVYRWNAWSKAWIQSAGCDGSGPCDDYVAAEGTYRRWRAPRA